MSSSSEKQLRDTLQYIKAEWWDKHYPEDIFVGGLDSDDGVNELVKIRGMLDSALAASEPTDLKRLVEWLRREEKECQKSLANQLWLLGRTDMIAYTLRHIADEFGVGGE